MRHSWGHFFVSRSIFGSGGAKRTQEARQGAIQERPRGTQERPKGTPKRPGGIQERPRGIQERPGRVHEHDRASHSDLGWPSRPGPALPSRLGPAWRVPTWAMHFHVRGSLLSGDFFHSAFVASVSVVYLCLCVCVCVCITTGSDVGVANATDCVTRQLSNRSSMKSSKWKHG